MASFRPRNVTESLQIIWRRRLLVLFVGAVVLLAALIIILKIPHVYDSRALVLVSGQIYDRQANGAQIAVVTEQMTSRARLETLIGKYGLYQPVAKMDLAVEQMERDVKLETKYRSDSAGFPESFSVSYRHSDPAIAKQVVSELVFVFDQANSTLEQQAAQEAKAIRTEMANIEAQMSDSNQRRAVASASASAAGRAAGNMERLRAERSAAASTLESLKDKQFLLERQIADQKRLIAQQQELVKSASPPDDGRSTSAYSALVRRKAELEMQIKDYAANYTEKYPKLVEAREQLADVNRRIAQVVAAGEQARATAASPESQELRNLQRELTRMETELDVVQREISRKQQSVASLPDAGGARVPVPVASPSSSQGSYEYDSLRERYTALLRREEAIRPFQPSTAGPGTPFFQMVDPPNLPQAPAAPNRRLLLVVALAMALVAGLVAAAVAEARRFYMIYDERDVSYYLGVPVVALLPETLGGAERDQAQRRLFRRSLAYLVIGAASVPVLAVILNSLQIFQILGNK